MQPEQVAAAFEIGMQAQQFGFQPAGLHAGNHQQAGIGRYVMFGNIQRLHPEAKFRQFIAEHAKIEIALAVPLAFAMTFGKNNPAFLVAQHSRQCVADGVFIQQRQLFAAFPVADDQLAIPGNVLGADSLRIEIRVDELKFDIALVLLVAADAIADGIAQCAIVARECGDSDGAFELFQQCNAFFAQAAAVVCRQVDRQVVTMCQPQQHESDADDQQVIGNVLQFHQPAL